MADRKVEYNGFSINVPESESIDEIKEKLSNFFPEVMNATYTLKDDNTIVFAQKAGDKGW